MRQIQRYENQALVRMELSNRLVKLNVIKRSKCILAAIAKNTAIATQITDCLHSFYFFSKIHARNSKASTFKWRSWHYTL